MTPAQMTPERWQQIETLYLAALERTPEARAAWLAAACAEDADLRTEVEALLRADGASWGFIEGNAMEQEARQLTMSDVAPTDSPLRAGQSVGVYQIQSLLGKGGMGEVYLAEDERLHRRVALKVLPNSLAQDADRLRRFEQEAFAASALNHPNIISVYDIGESEAGRFIVMELVSGSTLREVIAAGHSLETFLSLSQQMAKALSAAHAAGITHRDIKPDNIMVRDDGYVKVLDFGLARLLHQNAHDSEAVTLAQQTTPGTVMGTVAYMSPEQARGESVSHPSDIFALGIVLYELATGRHPFKAETMVGYLHAITLQEPAPPQQWQPKLPAALNDLILRMLNKEASQRPTASEIVQVLAEAEHKSHSSDNEPVAAPNAILPQATVAAPATVHPREPELRPRPGEMTNTRRWLWAAGLLVCLAGAGWWGWRAYNIRQARAVLPRLEQLAQEDRFFEAHDLAQSVRAWAPDDPTLARLTPMIADDLSIKSEPAGARVYLKRFGAEAERQFIGVTPMEHQKIARGGYLVTLEKEGYAAFERTVTGLRMNLAGVIVPSPPLSFEARLIEAAQTPPRMVFVPGGEYRLASWDRPTERIVKLDDYFIDKYEVTNREYKEFITAGGYLKREYWRQPIVINGRALVWEEAVLTFRDRTGLQGPRTWANQDFPAARAEHPVTDISWYEAAAYAAFRGKELPTVYQWEKAARSRLGQGSANYFLMPWGPFTNDTEQRANFLGQGALAVDSLPFGQSAYGCYHMAGNVSEWCRNESSETPGKFTVTGGSWADPPYLFARYGPYPGGFSADKLGFRCALTSAPANGKTSSDQGAQAIFAPADIPAYQPVSDEKFRSWQKTYEYDVTAPLDAQMVAVQETPDWRREKITYNGAAGARAIAYLYLPKNYPPPWQLIQYTPGDDVYGCHRSLTERVDATLSPYVKAGRAVLAVVLEGFIERDRPPDFVMPESNTIDYRDMILQQVVDGRRGLDYALSRGDLDASRVAFFISSSGPGRKNLLAAVEPRYRAIVLIGGGFLQTDRFVYPEINAVNLAPRILPPKLLLQGRYDENATLHTNAEPYRRLLPEPKRVVWFDGGHVPALEISVPLVNAWLNEQLGPVRKGS